MSAIFQIKHVLSNWPPQGELGDMDCSEEEVAKLDLRLWQALKIAHTNPQSIKSRDLASLVRHTLRNEEEKNSSAFYLLVPVEEVSPWPSENVWREHGVEVRREGHQYRIRALPWIKQDWLTGVHVHRYSHCQTPFSPADGAKRRRPELPRIPLDPALEGKFDSIDSYWSTPQAEAIRGIMLSPKGSTHLMVYPTGSGKSLMGLAASMVGRPRPSGVNLVIVPTVALALDQVEQAKRSFQGAHIDAWESGTPQQQRNKIKERIRSGNQTFLYTSPESLIGSLKPDLLAAAESGFLKTFIVDEAHLVSQWGSSFRPSFQSMTALWRELRAQCDLRTILMSATVTVQTYEDLMLFYDLPDAPLQVSAAIHLRAEIDCYSSRCDTREQKRKRVLELLRHAPRPAILYVTMVQDARDWYQTCREYGWARVGLLHGESSSEEKKQAIQRWRENETDLMVATSAFGLGMDKGDVRTVIHACVPETIDRYYQEVGRGGRDGNAAVALMVHDPDDFNLGRRMSAGATIGDDLGLQRWRTMIQAATHIGDNVYDINIDSIRPGLVYEGERNRQWNMRTLVLLARSGVLAFRHLPPPEIQKDEGEGESAFDARRNELWERYRATSRVELLRANPLDEESWNEATEEHRESASHHQRSSWQGVESVLNGRRELISILREVYTVKEAGIENIAPSPNGIAPMPPDRLCSEVTEQLSTIAQRNRFISYPTIGKPNGYIVLRLAEALKKLAANGIREISLPEAWRIHAWEGVDDPLGDASRASREQFVIVRSLEQEDEHANVPLVPRVTLLTPDFVNKPVPVETLSVNRPIHLILIPEESVDPAHADRRIVDARSDVVTIQVVFDLLS